MADSLTYREHPSTGPLRRFVQCLWELKGHCDEASSRLIVPDGCLSLVLNFGRPLEQVIGADEAVRRPRTLLIGEVRRPISLQSQGCVELLGVRFWPGAIRSFIDTPVDRIVDSISDDAPLSPKLRRALVQIVHTADGADRLRLLRGALAEQVRNAAEGDALVAAVVRTLVLREGAVQIAALAEAFDVSRRRLERKFAQEVGIAPKYLANVLRFRRVLRETQRRSAGWTELAADCGYCDQSHLIRDFKRFTGRTPEAYFAEGRSLATLRIESTDSLHPGARARAIVQYATTGSP